MTQVIGNVLGFNQMKSLFCLFEIADEILPHIPILEYNWRLFSLNNTNQAVMVNRLTREKGQEHRVTLRWCFLLMSLVKHGNL